MAKYRSGVHVFQTLEDSACEQGRRWLSFAAGVGVHGLALGLVLALGIIFPAEIEEWVTRPPIYLDLDIPPIPEEAQIRTQPTPKVTLDAPRLRAEQMQMPVVPLPWSTSNPAPPQIALQVPPPAEPVFVPTPASLPHQQPPVRTGAFSGSQVPATLKLPAREVQTGGFGSPEGFAGHALGGSRGNVAKLGSFDLPAGPGYGSGLGGTHGARGTVASAGFGSGPVAPTRGSGGGGRGGVVAGGFDIKPVAPTTGTTRAAPQTPVVTPVEIVSKPTPVFTEEARRLGIQGEVVLSVVFAALGRVRVLKVLQGLGHGLDEEAWRAAEQIQFRPAQREGQPVDFPATLRVVFQLSG